MTFKKVDFVTTNDIDIDIVNKSDEDAKVSEEKLNIPNYQMLLQDPELEKINRVFIKRHILRISGTPANLIKQMIPE
jgi:7,8-dihydro-6-hydroxymethylpterin-pyrophosphokinase